MHAERLRDYASYTQRQHADRNMHPPSSLPVPPHAAAPPPPYGPRACPRTGSGSGYAPCVDDE